MTETPKIWIVSEYYYPTVTSTGYYLTEIAEYLAAREKNVHVICTNSNYNTSAKLTLEKEEVRNNVHIHRTLTGNIDKNNFVLRSVRLLLSSLALFIKVVKKVGREEKVLVVTNPAFLLLLLPLAKRMVKFEYTILVHDIFPENLAAIGKIKSNSFLYRKMKNIFDYAYSQADAYISIGRDMAEVIKEKVGDNIKTTNIPNWADVDDVFPVAKENTKMIKELGLSKKFVFQFAGNLGHSQGLDNILNAIKLVDNESLHFLFIGTGAKEETIKKFINKNPLDNVTLVGFQQRSEQNDFLNACDVAIVTLSDGMFGLGVPSKSYNIMAAGKPILIVADKNSEISLCVKEYGLGWVVTPNDPKLLKEIIIKIYHERAVLQEMSNQSRKIAETEFAKEIILQKYVEALN